MGRRSRPRPAPVLPQAVGALAVSVAIAVLALAAAPADLHAAPENAPAERHPTEPGALLGRPAPPMTVREVVGEGPVDPAAASSRRRARVVAFVATWCAACRLLEPVLADLATDHPQEELAVVAYSHEPRPLIARHYISRGLPFPVAQCTGRTALRYAATALPTVLAVDPGGVVRGAWQGMGAETVLGLRRTVDAVLGK